MIEVALSLLCVGAFVFLAFRRWRHQRGQMRMDERRLLFVDLILVVAAFEVLFDALAVAFMGTQAGEACRLLAFVGKGGLTFGGLALLLTMPPIEQRVRQR